jgi:hypothetical protein
MVDLHLVSGPRIDAPQPSDVQPPCQVFGLPRQAPFSAALKSFPKTRIYGIAR